MLSGSRQPAPGALAERARVAHRALAGVDYPVALAAMIVLFLLMLLIGIGLMLALTPTGAQTIASAGLPRFAAR
jgi:hypothetical protein